MRSWWKAALTVASVALATRWIYRQLLDVSPEQLPEWLAPPKVPEPNLSQTPGTRAETVPPAVTRCRPAHSLPAATPLTTQGLSLHTSVGPSATPSRPSFLTLTPHRAWAPASVTLLLLVRRLSFQPVLLEGRLEAAAAANVREAEAKRDAYWREAEVSQPSPRSGRWVRSLVHAIGRAAGLILSPLRYRLLRRTSALAALALLIVAYAPLGLVLAPLHERAAFAWNERFDDGFTHWVHASALEPDRSGAIRVQGLAMHDKTTTLRNYEVNFAARIQKRSIGWVVRAEGVENFYVFKLTDRGRSPAGRKFDLTRYPIVAGSAPARSDMETVPLVLRVADNDFLDVAVRVTEDQILTTVNGYGVDAWKHPKRKTGGIGLLAENGESFLVKSLTISGNEDFLGLFLWGAEETFRSVRKNLMSLTAMQVSGRLTDTRAPC